MVPAPMIPIGCRELDMSLVVRCKSFVVGRQRTTNHKQRSFSLEVWLSLLQKGNDAFMMIGGLAGGLLIVRLGLKLRLETVLERLIDQSLGEGDGAGRERRQARRQLPRCRSQLGR